MCLAGKEPRARCPAPSTPLPSAQRATRRLSLTHPAATGQRGGELSLLGLTTQRRGARRRSLYQVRVWTNFLKYSLS